MLREYPGTLPELREWPFRSESVFPEIGVVPRLLRFLYTSNAGTCCPLRRSQRQRCIKILCPKDPDFYTPLALKRAKWQHLPALEVYKNQSPNLGSTPFGSFQISTSPLKFTLKQTLWKDPWVTPTPVFFQKHCSTNGEAYCSTNGRRIAAQMGGVLQGFPFFEA